MAECLNKSRVMNRKPVAYLTCNGSPPVGDKPSLMTFREVRVCVHGNNCCTSLISWSLRRSMPCCDDFE